MISNVGMLSYLSASVAFALLLMLLTFAWRDRPYRVIMMVACMSTAVWAALISAGTLLKYPPIVLMHLFEFIRNACWIYFLLVLTATRFDGVPGTIDGKKWRPIFIAIALVSFALLFLLPLIMAYFSIQADFLASISLTFSLGVPVVGLLLLEQVFRNASDSERWSIKYLCMGLGVIFAYDLFMYSEALLFNQLDAQYWQARGFANAVVTPLMAISIARSSSWKSALTVSRQVVFHTVSLLGAGIYLILMAIVGYFIKFMGGSWGGVLQISFLIGSGALLLTLLFSGQIRAQTRVFLSKHFFNYKYDYREEWLKFTNSLAGIGNNVPEGIIRTMSALVDSPAGLLWGSSDGKSFALLSHWSMPAPEETGSIEELASWLQTSLWVIDINELEQNPELYAGLVLPQSITAIKNAWLIIPLMFGSKLQGILLLKHSDMQRSINWEDRDLLKTAGRQAGSHLAQHLASEALVEARQFDAFNRLSAYVIHDLKNILAQQSLMVSNAEKHKNNAEFVDDMISTVSNSVERMTKLMVQMRSGKRETKQKTICLKSVLEEVVANRSTIEPTPSFSVEAGEYAIQSDSDRIATVFSHLIQNAQEACHHNAGEVIVCLEHEKASALITVEDNGKGMDALFVRTRLFKPFDSTKGLTGMGIGAFESREFIRSLGGDIGVTSTPEKGSIFSVRIPCEQEQSIIETQNIYTGEQ
jgi:putative PEP-CTERM system histidine kinase